MYVSHYLGVITAAPSEMVDHQKCSQLFCLADWHQTWVSVAVGGVRKSQLLPKLYTTSEELHSTP